MWRGTNNDCNGANMNRNDSYSSNRRRNRRRNERQGHSRENRNGQHARDSRERRNYRERDSKKNGGQRGIQREIQRILQKVSAENETAIREFRENVWTCEICGRQISAEDIESAFAKRDSENPVHFDCVLKQLTEREQLKANERVTYIGQGKFAVLTFVNPHDLRKFSIRKTIEWENRENRLDWRNKIASLFSQVR